MKLPAIQIQQTPSILGMDTVRGRQSIRQPRATMEMEITRPDLQISQPRGELNIDQSRAWDGLGKPGTLTMMSRIYAQGRDMAMEGIARIVDNGNNLANIKSKNNAIADLGFQNTIATGEYDFAGPVSYDCVDITYTARKPEFEARNAIVDMNTHANAVEHDYQMGKVDIYVKQYASIEITPPNIDILV